MTFKPKKTKTFFLPSLVPPALSQLFLLLSFFLRDWRCKKKQQCARNCSRKLWQWCWSWARLSDDGLVRWLDLAGRLWIKLELAGGAMVGLLTEVDTVLRMVSRWQRWWLLARWLFSFKKKNKIHNPVRFNQMTGSLVLAKNRRVGSSHSGSVACSILRVTRTSLSEPSFTTML